MISFQLKTSIYPSDNKKKSPCIVPIKHYYILLIIAYIIYNDLL